ncbi:MAG: DNA repair protein RecN [Lachnospiraceae bacterium]|nr:DNA repair protein RecN [Lachnospiraceae bacterium]
MLENLHVKNLALIDEQEVTFGRGMNILTGETGAGKSVIIGSINLALGAKADKDYIRAGADYALIELSFSLNEQQCRQVREMELPLEDENTLILQRKIMPGKSTCRVCGESVSASQLKKLAPCLLDLYGQHEHQSLLKPSSYRKMLDAYVGEEAEDIQHRLKALISDYRDTKEELDRQSLDEREREGKIRLLEFEVQEIEAAALTPSEDEQIEKKYRKMVNSRKMKETIGLVYGLTGYEEENSAGAAAGYALRELKSLKGMDEEIDPLIEQLTDIDNLLNDFNRSMADYQDSLEFDGEEFAALEERLNVINHLKNKYGNTLEAVLDSAGEKAEELERLRHFEEYMDQLKAKESRCKKEILSCCEELSKLRQKAAAPLSAKLKEAMADLNFQDVKFDISVTPEEEHFTQEGYDQVEFLISTNPGEAVRPLWQIASGGELSRIMLAFKTVSADRDETDTLIFDEIDTGISGKTAWKVAEKLGRLSGNHQIICITHLAQIASMADGHFLIEKGLSGERTVTGIRKLTEEESLNELARLLGSGEMTRAVLENAKEMRENARAVKG